MTLRRAFTLFLCILMAGFVVVGPGLLKMYKVDYDKSYEHMKGEISWRGVITVWDYPRLNTSNGTKLSWMTAKVKAFEKLYPGVYIDFKELDQSSGTSLLKAAAITGAYPDVAPVGSDYYFMSQGYLEELDSYITEAERQEFIDTALDSASHAGKLYGLPWMMTGYTLLINTRLFSERNVDLPKDGNWTYEQFVEAMKKLTYDTNRKGGPDVVGFASSIQPGNYSIYGLLLSDGAEVINRQNGDYSFYGAEALAGVQKLWQLKYEHKVTSQSFGEATAGEVLASFINGKTAVITAGSWTVPYLRSLQSGSMEFTTANYPRGSAQQQVLLDSNTCSFAVFKQTDENKKRMCVEFVKFLTSADNQEELKNYGYFSARKASADLYQNDKEMSMIQRSLSFVEPVPRHKNWEQIDLILQSRIKAAVNGELSPEQAIQEARELLRKYTE